jgi:hypothetical protein
MIVAEKHEAERLLQLESRDDGTRMLWIKESKRPDRDRGHRISASDKERIIAEFGLVPVQN